MMFDDIFDGPSGSTPLEEEEKETLRSKTITTRGELNVEEESNIASAEAWLRAKQMKIEVLLTVKQLQQIHKRMLNRVWKWAGKFRQSDKSIGILWWQIPTQLDSLCKDVLTQVKDSSPSRWMNDEIAIRFHHRLVQIHPFTDGNGRHARLVTDKLSTLLGENEFSWGQTSLHAEGQAREKYVDALRAADLGDIGPLLVFARS